MKTWQDLCNAEHEAEREYLLASHNFRLLTSAFNYSRLIRASMAMQEARIELNQMRERLSA
jgi:hypothetical protein